MRVVVGFAFFLASFSWASTLYNLPGSGSSDQVSLHLINNSNEAASISGTLFHQNGEQLGAENTLLAKLSSNARVEFSAEELELIFGVTTWTKRARIELTGDTDRVSAIASVFTPSQTTTNLSCTSDNIAPNIPSSEASDTAYIRISNTSNKDIAVSGTLFHQDGRILGLQDAVLIPLLASKSTIVLTALDLEQKVGVRPWTKRARLELNDRSNSLRVMGLIRSASTLTNMSCVSRDAALVIPNDAGNGDKPFIRIFNNNDNPVDVTGTLRDQNGYALTSESSPIVSSLEAKSASVLSLTDLKASMNPSVWDKRARLVIDSDINNLEVMNLIRPEMGVLTNMSCAASERAGFIPSTNSDHSAYVRIYNDTTDRIGLRGTLFDDNGQLIGIAETDIGILEGYQVGVYSSSKLEALFGHWQGKATLRIDSPTAGIRILNLVRSPSGALTNLSCTSSGESIESFNIYSSSYENDKEIPVQHACRWEPGGENLSPQLSWSQVPSGTKSFALIMDDPDANSWVHWNLWNIPKDTRDIPLGVSGIGQSGLNDAGTSGYFGPCPPTRHNYIVKVYALDDEINLTQPVSRKQFEQQYQNNILGAASWSGSYTPR